MSTNDTKSSLSRREFVRAATLGIALAAMTRGIEAQAGEFAPSAETQAALNSAQAEYEAAMEQLAYLNGLAEEAQYNLSVTEGQLEETNNNIAELEGSITQKQIELSEAQDVLAERVSANYKAGNTEAIEVLLDASSFEDFANRVYYEGKLSDADADAIAAVKEIKAELESEEAQLQVQKAEQEELVAQQQAQTEELNNQVWAMEDYAAGLSEEVVALMAQAQAEIEAAREAAYQAYLAELAAQQAAEQAAAEEAARQAAAAQQAAEPAYTEPAYTEPASYYSEPAAPSYSSSGGTGNHASSAIDVAWGCIGVPYVWGGSDMSGFDCSGLAMYCYACLGYSIPHYTGSLIAQIQSLGNWRTSMSSLSVGDLVFPSYGHVGIYAGGGMMIHAPSPGRVVEYASVYAFIGGGSPI